MRDNLERLLDIQEAMQHIQKHAGRGRSSFETDELLQVWVVHHLQIMGEAAARLSDELKNVHPAIPWKEIVGMRNILIHGYFDIDPDVVWRVVEHDLPTLAPAIQRMIDELKKARET